MTNLVEFTLTGCTKCEYLPPLHLLCPYLKKLCIKYCTKLQGIRDNCRYPYELEWNQQGAYVSDDDAEDDNYGFPYFPALSRLDIVLCPKLDRMPLFPTVDAELELYGCSERLLLRTMIMNSSRLVRPPLSQLSSLLLWEIYDLKYLGVCNLTSIQYLGIRDCPRLATLPPAMRCLTRLQKLSIQECPLLKERCREGVGEDWPNISHIPSVELRD
ncbi:unnamed protein product [Linum trigynum]|uniref:Uncharacterized protein n=1 Tax=Linum trigynum TaxID=586398 RepID=A0AAV2EJV7_9ROSI